ncbi:MAG: gliding motility-associated ABC transporter permease subunit GldF, partial [Dinghuibacter sp.]|nr:gliding motility-associated ABC transporter permease subunit GldF [Dinghuibacter sp.]
FTQNAVAAFLISLLACLVMYFLFTAISRMSMFSGGADYYLAMLGLDFHYASIGRGVIDTRDVIYFFSIILLFSLITYKNLEKK